MYVTQSAEGIVEDDLTQTGRSPVRGGSNGILLWWPHSMVQCGQAPTLLGVLLAATDTTPHMSHRLATVPCQQRLSAHHKQVSLTCGNADALERRLGPPST